MELQTKIEKRISLLGLKKQFVAEKCNIGVTVFSMWLKGKRNIKDEQVVDLKNYLGIE